MVGLGHQPRPAQGQVPWLIRRRYGIPDGGGDEYQLLASTKKFPKKAPKSFIKNTKKVKKKHQREPTSCNGNPDGDGDEYQLERYFEYLP